MIRTLLDKAQCMLSNAGLCKQFWTETVMHACHLISCLTSAAIECRTPAEVWYGEHINDYASLNVFGSIDTCHESKLDPRAK